MHPAIEQLLGHLNTELAKHPVETFVTTEGGRKGAKLDFSKGDTLQEWEVRLRCAIRLARGGDDDPRQVPARPPAHAGVDGSVDRSPR